MKVRSRMMRLGLSIIGITGVVCLMGLAALFMIGPDRVKQISRGTLERVLNKKDMVLQSAGFLAGTTSPTVQTDVLVNQLGYRPHDPKVGIIKGNHDGKPFEVINVSANLPVFTGTIHNQVQWDQSTGEITSLMDFSVVQAPGIYRLQIPGEKLTSADFRINKDVYNIVFTATTESFYYQRCGIAINNGTQWTHPLCHTEDGPFFHTPSEVIDATGGWHDAGDYGKFVVTGAVSAAFLLYLYENQTSQFTDGQLSIPESKNGIPDILDEARWELEWLLKMQREDGALYHKVQNQKWTGNYLPELDPDRRFVNPISSAATADFAAVAALGARIFRGVDAPFAHRLYKASLLAWEFLVKHPDIVPEGGFQNPPGVEGGAYGDTNDLDERLWASVELYRLTANMDYHQYFVSRYNQIGGFYAPLTWSTTDAFALASYLRMPKHLANTQVTNALRSALIQHCNNRLLLAENNGYRYVLKPEEYYWGSNSVAMGEAFKLILAYELTLQTPYRDSALDQLHYNLGRNTFNTTFVTGIGSNPVRSPHHQFSMKLGLDEPVPGLAVGGPNNGEDRWNKKISEYPGKCYVDVNKNYLVNEVAINYTAPVTYVAGYFSNFEKSGR